MANDKLTTYITSDAHLLQSVAIVCSWQHRISLWPYVFSSNSFFNKSLDVIDMLESLLFIAVCRSSDLSLRDRPPRKV